MCGRYSLTTPLEAMRQVFQFDSQINLAPRYNIAPSQNVLVLRNPTTDSAKSDSGGAGPELAQLRWGLIPSWAKDATMGARMINARSETVAEKPAFRTAWRRRRCLIPADGFYEWRKAADGSRQPYRITFKSGMPFAFAGLWESWRSPDGETVESCTILTTEASPFLRAVHHRMPVILRPENHARWLDCSGDPPSDLLLPFEDSELRFFPVAKIVNSPRNDTPECLEPVELPEPSPESEPQSTPAPAAKLKQGELF